MHAWPVFFAHHTDEPRAKLMIFMSRVRRRVSWMACFWLTCQLAGIVAAPLAFCCRGVEAVDSDDDVCCPGLLPGQICPMHHKVEGKPTCKMRDACGRADAALVSLAGIVGLLPSMTVAVSTFVAGDRFAALVPSAISRAYRPDSPPPRA
jgi:hypothetical protein